MFFLYILKNSKQNLYIGVTSDVAARVERHSVGRGAKFTKDRKDFNLVYSEKYLTLVEAVRREKQLKGWSRAKKEALIAQNVKLLKEL